MAQAVAFTIIGSVAVLLSALAMIRLSMMRLESPIGRSRDGLRSGATAPAWRLVDTTGTVRQVPHGRRRQALLFTDHSIVSFPKVVTGVSRLQQEAPELDIILVSRVDADVTAMACDMAGLRLPVVVVDDRFYKRHNVWVMPHLLLLDEAGKVLVTGNVSEAQTVANMWRHALLVSPAARRVEVT